jgi:hypothetical protein
MSLPTEDITLKFSDSSYSGFSVFIKNALIDTGSQKTLIRQNILEQNKIPMKKLNQKMYLSNALNETSNNIIENYIKVNITFNQSQIELKDKSILVIPGHLNYPVILGIDILKNLGMDFRKPKIFSNNFKISTNNQENDIINLKAFNEPKTENVSLITGEETILYPGEKYNVKINFDREQQFISSFNILQPTEQILNHLIEIPLLFKFHKYLTLVNLNEKTIVIPPGCIVAKCLDVENSEKSVVKNYSKINSLKLDCNNLISYDQLSSREKSVHDRECHEWRTRREELVLKNNLSVEI